MRRRPPPASTKRACVSHQHAPTFAIDYPSTYTIDDIDGHPITFTFRPIGDDVTDAAANITIDTYSSPLIVIQPSAADAVILAQFVRETAKTARHPDGMRRFVWHGMKPSERRHQ